MQGRQKTFTIGGVTLKLRRPSLNEMTDLEPKLRAILGEPETSEFNGDAEAILQQAVADESEADKEAFGKLADIGDRLELWDAWVKFCECERFLFGRENKKLSFIKVTRAEQYKALGLTDDETKELLEMVTTPETSMNSI